MLFNCPLVDCGVLWVSDEDCEIFGSFFFDRSILQFFLEIFSDLYHIIDGLLPLGMHMVIEPILLNFVEKLAPKSLFLVKIFL